jgi:hypothetical protein
MVAERVSWVGVVTLLEVLKSEVGITQLRQQLLETLVLST